MYILHLSYDDMDNPWLGGGGAINTHSVNRKLSRRHDIAVLTGSFPNAPRFHLRDGVRYYHIGLGNSYLLSRISFVLSAPIWMKNFGADLVVVDFSAYAPVVAPLYSRMPAVAVIHNILGKHPLRKYGPMGIGPFVAESLALRLYRFFISVSEFGARTIRTKNRGARVGVIPFAPSDELFQVSNLEANYVLFMGRLDIYQKGLDVLLRAFVEVHKRHPDVVLKVVGSGTRKSREQLDRLISEAGLRGCVQVEPFASGKRKLHLLSGALFLCVPSRYEGWPMVAVEAAASGKAVVGTDIPGLSEIVQNGTTGTLVPVGDWRSLSDAVCTLIEDPDLRRKMGTSAREWAEQFREDEIVRRRELFYREVVEDARD